MPAYEHVFLARQDLATAQVEAMTETFKRIVTDGKGAVTKDEYWGLRTLAYRIKKNRKAHYVMFNIDAPAPAVAELERQVALNEDILRYMTVKVDELGTEPSAMMRRNESRDRDRDSRGGDDRGGRGDRGDRPRGGGFGGDRGGAGGDRGGFRPRGE